MADSGMKIQGSSLRAADDDCTGLGAYAGLASRRVDEAQLQQWRRDYGPETVRKEQELASVYVGASNDLQRQSMAEAYNRAVQQAKRDAERDQFLKAQAGLQGAQEGPAQVRVGGKHYQELSVQPWDALKAWLTPEEYRGWCKGNAIVYLARERGKGGDLDIAKAMDHLDRVVQQ